MRDYDYIIIGFYLVFMLAIGLVFRRMSKNTSDYFRAGGAMPWWLTGASAWIFSFSAWTFTGAAGKVYESGPLVLATLHARSTELGLQKMIRLLGNSEAQSQALAHALRGVLCQALLPSVEGNRYFLATECLTPSPAMVRLIEAGDISGIRSHMAGGKDAGCHTMNDVLEQLLAEHKISIDDARNATTDRIGFADMV